MRFILIALLATCVGAARFYSSNTRKRSSSDGGFEEKLKDGYKLLKGVPNEDATVNLLKELHNMEEEIEQELPVAPQQSDNSMTFYGEFKNDHIEAMGDTLEEVNHNSKVDAALFQGDMILTKEQAKEIMDDVKETLSHRHKRQAFRDRRYPKTLWQNGVRYSFSGNGTEAAKRVFKKAVALWSQDTCIDFAESNSETDRITLIQGSGCWSYVGRIGGAQLLSLGQGCESVGTAAHELGHALGFYHTQSRHDRDDFITLSVENFLDGWLSQFTKQTESTNYNYNLTYDYGSVMHYGATSVSKNGRPVMVPRDINYLKTLGSAVISFYEKLMMNLHYKCLDKCTASSSAKCDNGGFPHPRDCSKCICPSGYDGKLCNERPSGCGKILEAKTSFQTLEDKVRGIEGKTGDDFTMCNYWIQAPAGSKIEVILESYTRGFAIDGCPYAGVEIKTGSDKRHTGYRFCSPENAGTPLISTYNIVPVITYSRSYETTTVLRYRIVSSGPDITSTTSQPTNSSTPEPTSGGTTTTLKPVCPTTGGSSVGPTTDGPSVGPTTDESSVGPTTDESSVGPTTDESSVGPTTDESSVGPTTDESSVGPTTDESSVGPTTDESSVGPTTDESSVGPTTDESSVGPTTDESSVGPTTDESSVGPSSTSTPNFCCRDSSVCATLMKWDFCRSSKYDDELRKLVCPQSCGFC